MALRGKPLECFTRFPCVRIDEFGAVVPALNPRYVHRGVGLRDRGVEIREVGTYAHLGVVRSEAHGHDPTNVIVADAGDSIADVGRPVSHSYVASEPVRADVQSGFEGPRLVQGDAEQR